MFGLEALSLAICVGTIWVVIVVGPRVPPVRSLVGFGLAFGASALFWSALRATRNRNFGVVFGGTVPQEVVKEGPYRYIRHPLYTAYLLNWIGCSVLAGSMILSLGTLAIASLYAFAARSEERDLLSSPLGKSYAEYKRNTGLLLPRVRAR
jgi:protein-S-isoprenylcysteine O-methyltransferase Ste14